MDGVHLLEFFDIVAFVPAGEHGIGTREGVDEEYLRTMAKSRANVELAGPSVNKGNHESNLPNESPS